MKKLIVWGEASPTTTQLTKACSAIPMRWSSATFTLEAGALGLPSTAETQQRGSRRSTCCPQTATPSSRT